MEAVKLNHIVSFKSEGLDYDLENDEDFTEFHRKLLCVARALLRQTKVIVIDDSSDDDEFNDILKGIVGSLLKSTTIITISQRLKNLMQCDRYRVFSYFNNTKLCNFIHE